MKKHIDSLIRWASEYEMNGVQAGMLLIFSVTLLFSPFLFFGKILLHADSSYLAYPSAYFFSHFLYSPISQFLFSGYPVPVAFEYGYFHPLYNLFYYLFDFLFAYHSLLWLDFIGAAIFTYLFTRKLGLSVYASVIAATAYTFSQMSVAWLGVPSVANAVFLLPAVMYCMFQIAHLRRIYILALGVIVGVAFLGTHYQFIVLALMGGGAFFLFEVWQSWKKELTVITNLKPIFYFSAGMLIALIISLPQAILSMSFFSVSTRELILVYSSAPHLDLIKYLLPALDIPFKSITEFRPYIGIAPLFFALVAGYAIFRKKINDEWASFFVWFFIICLVMSLQYSPILFILKYLPFLKYFAVQSRWMYLGNFALVVLAGYGFDYILREDRFPWERSALFFKRISIGLIVLFTSFTTLILFFGSKAIRLIQDYFDSNLYASTTHLPLEYYHDIIELMARKVFLNVSLVNLNVTLFIVFSICLYWLLRVGRRKILFSNIAVFFVLVNLLSVSALSFSMGDRHILTDKSKIAEFIHSREGDKNNYRVFGFIVPFAQYQAITARHPEAVEDSLIFAKEALVGNLSVFSEIPIVGGYNPMAFRRYQNIVGLLENTIARKTTEEKISQFLSQLNLLSALNVKYVVSPYLLESPYLDLAFSERVTSFEVPLYLYHNKKMVPRVFLANDVVFIPENNESESFTTITESKSDFKDVTFIECDKCTEVSKSTKDKGVINIVSENGWVLEVKVVSDRDEWLVVSNQAVPGWTVEIDGIAAHIYYANHAYQAVFVPKVEHKVSFAYDIIPWIN